MKIVSTKAVSLVTAVSSLMLLSACCDCGESDSSANDKSGSKVASSGEVKPVKKSEKNKDKKNLEGFWELDCQPNMVTIKEAGKTSKFAGIEYLKITKIKDKYQMESKTKVFATNKCKGKYKIDKEEPEKIPVETLDKIVTFIDNNHFTAPNDNGKAKATRISEKEYDNLKVASNNNKPKPKKEKEKKNTTDNFIGYWKLDCQTDISISNNKKFAGIEYLKVTKENGQYQVGGKTKDFTTNECKGKYKINEEEAETYTKEKIKARVTFIDKNTFYMPFKHLFLM